jgi:ADP-heptose:LPS heptosyltransferase
VVAIGKTWADCYGNLQDKKLEGTNYSFEDKLDIRQTAYVLSKTNLFIGCDSGSAHLACAVGTKAITLYGPVHPKSRMHEQTIPIFDGTCTKCNLITHSEVCRKNNHMCMNNITVEHVLREVEKAFILGEN